MTDNDIQRKSLKWQRITTFCTLVLAAAAIIALLITISNNSKLIKESIESRVAENRPLIDMRVHPLSKDEKGGMVLEIKNVGKGPAYNINYSYHYYDLFTKEIIFEYAETHSGDDCFTVLEPGKVLNWYTEEDKKRFNVSEEDGLPHIFTFFPGVTDRIQQRLDSSGWVVCAVYVEYEDFKGNAFWSDRRFGIKFSKTHYPFPTIAPYMQYEGEMTKARGAFMNRARKRAVKGIKDFEGLKIYEKGDLMQTERLKDTLSRKDLK